MSLKSLMILPTILIFGAQVAHAQYKYPFQNPALSADQRISNLLSLMTLQEKVDLLGKNLNVPRLGIYGSGHIDSIPGSSGQVEGLHGPAMGGVNHWERRSPGGPGKWGGISQIPTTQFPQPVGLGETWDPELIEKAAAEEGYEARFIFQSYDRGGLIVRAPNADLARDPRWGRSEESYGEDPYLTGTMAVAYVKGLPGSDPRYWQTASLVKHFMANSNEDGRESSSSNFDGRLLHEYYSVPFRMAIEQGKANAFMTAYNAVNGIPMAVSPLLKNLAMDQWSFNGLIDTDRGALTDLVIKYHYYPDLPDAAAGAIHAGVNQFLDNYRQPVEKALHKRLIREADIDQNLRGVLRVMIRLGFLDPPALNPYTKIRANNEPPPWSRDSSRTLALRVTEESIVLLKNSAHLLPLDRSKLKSIALIGPLADEVDMDGYGGTPPFAVTPLQGILDLAGPRVLVRYSKDRNTAIQLAKTSDVAIVFAGNCPFCRRDTSGQPCPGSTAVQEAIDRQQINLDSQQANLIQLVYRANHHTIVVLISSFPYIIDWSAKHIPAIVHMSHSSEEEGDALADVIFGKVNPGGRLVVTWPRSLSQLPSMMDYNIRDGHTYMYFKGKPLFPFGYGLSYTIFRYSNIRTSSSTVPATGKIDVTFEVKNTGSRAGDEVVQMYVKHLNSKVSRPFQKLAGFQRISLQPGQQQLVHLPLGAESLAYWSDRNKQWTLEKDQVKVMIGSSSSDIRLSTVISVLR